MRLAIGWALGVLSAWTALALFRRIPGLPDVDTSVDGEDVP